MTNRKALSIFLILSFTFGWILLASFSLAMWMPGLAAIIAKKATGESLKTLNLGRLGPKTYLIWAWLPFPILAVVTLLFTLLFGFGELDPDLTLINQSLSALPQDAALSPALLLGIQIISAMTLAPLFNTLFALGEELGWRGFLLPALLPLGEWKAIILSNIIWGVWHAPAILQGHNYPEMPVLGVGMMVIFTVLTGIIFSWLYLNTQSPWVPALAHGTLNAVASLPILFLLPGGNLSLGGNLASVAGWAGLALFVLWLVLTGRVPVNVEMLVAEDVIDGQAS